MMKKNCLPKILDPSTWWSVLVAFSVLALFWVTAPYIRSAYALNQGASALKKNNLESAAYWLQKSIDSSPNSPWAYHWLRNVYLQTGDMEKAQSVAEKALELEPNNPLLQLELGDVYDIQGSAEKAIAYYETWGTMDRAGRLLVNYLKLADVLWAAGDEEGAVAIWRNKVRGMEYGDLYANWRLMQYDADDEEAAAQYEEEIRHFPLENFSAPPDPRLTSYQSQAIVGVVNDGFWSRETLLKTILFWRSHRGKQESQTLIQSLIEAFPNDVDLWFQLAEVHRGQGDFGQAESEYLELLEIDPYYTSAYLRLGQMAQESGEINTAIVWYEQLVARQPEELLGMKKLAETKRQIGLDSEAERIQNRWLKQLVEAGPAITASQTLDNGWTFVGYRVDEERLIKGDTSPLILFWQGEGLAGSEDDGWFELGNGQWVQVIEESENLVVNGDFEQGWSDNGPTGFPYDIYRMDPAARQLKEMDRDGKSTITALLDNTVIDGQDLDRGSSFLSSSIPVENDRLYLQTGWALSDGGRIYLGRKWICDSSVDGPPSYSSYVLSGGQTDSWQHYAGITQPLSCASQVQIWLLNYKSEGQVYFDNIMLIPVGKPGI